MTSKDEWQRMYDSGKLDQAWTGAKSAAAHAEKWLGGTAHLLDGDVLPHAERIVRQAKRGLLTEEEVNDHMTQAVGSIYPPYEPDTSPTLNVPDHLGPQFHQQ